MGGRLVDGLQDDFTVQYCTPTTTDSRGEKHGGCLPSPASRKRGRKMEGRGERYSTVLYVESTPDEEQEQEQEQDYAWTWPFRKWQREGRPHCSKLAMSSRLFLPPSSESSTATPRVPGMCRASPGLLASGFLLHSFRVQRDDSGRPIPPTKSVSIWALSASR
jgi:hypothetical protein